MSPEAIAARLAACRGAGHHPVPAGADDPAVDPMAGRDPVVAAVLVPLVERPTGLTVMLTRRTAHLAHHPGQISFPGGRLEPEDRGDRVVCALRETTEEVGLSRDRVRVLGLLDDCLTGTGFIITPVVGLVRPPFSLTPDPFEVAEVLEVPLAFILDRSNHHLYRREGPSRRRTTWSLLWGEALIWGATAGMLVTLSTVLGNDHD